MLDDERCCGTGTCIIDAYGLCWCGQQWDGVKMYRPAMEGAATLETSELIQTAEEADPE